MDGSSIETGVRAGLALPTIPELSKIPARIDESDERDLRWYFETPSVATITQSSGAFGGQLERAECYGYGALPCRRCGGKWTKDVVTRAVRCPGGETVFDADGRPCEEFTLWRDGTGRQPKGRIGKGGRRETYAMALARYRVQQRIALKIVLTKRPKPSAESGVDADLLWDATVASYWERGEALMTEDDFREAFSELPADWTETCEQCGGIGVVPRRTPTGYEREQVTAWPKGSSVSPFTVEALDYDGLTEALFTAHGDIHDAHALIRSEALARWLGVAEVLRDVETLSPVAREGLERFYAPRESRASWGRLGLVELAGSASKVGELQDHMGQVFNLAAYGAAS